MSHFKFAILDRFSLEGREIILRQPGLLESKTEDIDIAIIRTKVKVGEDFLDKYKNLKFIVTATNGFDHIDILRAMKTNIQVAFCPEGGSASAAELTLLLALGLSRKILSAQKCVRSGIWDRESTRGGEISGKTWGILGLGRIGQRVARAATALGAEVVAYDPYVDDGVFVASQVSRVGLKELFISADILSLHTPLTRETLGIVNSRTLDHMDPSVLIINSARGALVQEADLIHSLKSGSIGGFASDVFVDEPLNRNSVFLDFDNVLLTPHMGANTKEAFKKSCDLAAQRVVEFVEGRKCTASVFEENWVKEVILKPTN